MSLDNQTRKSFRSIGHKLHPLVIVKSLSANVSAEVDRALTDHELVKIRVLTADRDEKKMLVSTICTTLGAELVQLAGHVALLYRAARKPDPQLSNVLRHKSS